MKTKQELAGIYVASITAYDQAGNVDAAALQKLMQRNINEGAAGFFVGGSSGECFMLTEAERVQVFEAAAAYAGKTNLIAHVGAIGTAEAIVRRVFGMALKTAVLNPVSTRMKMRMPSQTTRPMA